MSVMKIFWFCHSVGEILFCKIVPFETNIFISIMFELWFTKIRISQETIMDQCESSLDVSLFQITGQMIFFLLRFWNWKKVQWKFNETSIGHNFFQEMPASAIDDAFIPVCKAFFALRFRVRLEQFKLLYVAHVLNHLLLSSYWTGCRLCFVENRVEEHVGEGGSRSSWPFHKHESSVLVSQQNVVKLEFGRPCSFRSALIIRYLARDLRHGRQRVSPFYHV